MGTVQYCINYMYPAVSGMPSALPEEVSRRFFPTFGSSSFPASINDRPSIPGSLLHTCGSSGATRVSS